MKVTLTENLDVEPIDIEFEIWFEFSRKKSAVHNHWFTPTGKCKVWVGGCHMQHLGNLGEGQYDKLMKAMKKAKCDVLTDGRDYYTTGNDNLIKITNMETILYQANEEYNARFAKL